jgi:protocatechuate 3,4-dioxygenase beta subunit
LRAIAQIGTTDEAGRYRLTNIAPGRYYLLAGRIDSPSYYPGSRDVSSARPLTILPGSTEERLNFW